MLYIEVPDMNDSMSAVTIDNNEYLLRFTYNERCDFWSFGIYDIEEQPIVAMTKIVPNFPLTHFYVSTDLPDGTFGAISNNDVVKIEKRSFIDGISEFVYIPKWEVE